MHNLGLDTPWILSKNQSIEISSETITLIKGTSLHKSSDDKDLPAYGLHLSATECAYILTWQKSTLQFKSDYYYKQIPIEPLCGLLAFIDEAPTGLKGIANRHQSPNIQVSPAIEAIHFESDIQFERWLILDSLRQTNQGRALRMFLRTTEVYQLVIYLLTKNGKDINLKHLCRDYGLSYSHFRRICKRALGGAPKAKMAQWRVAKSVLEILDRKYRILDVALFNGYASAGHICREMKKQLGLNPTALLKKDWFLSTPFNLQHDS